MHLTNQKGEFLMRKITLHVSAAFAAALMPFLSSAAWQPGLLGGYVNSYNSGSYMTVEPTEWVAYSGPHAATNRESSSTSTTACPPIWASNRTWVYKGQVFLSQGTHWFCAQIDDARYLKLGGTKVIDSTSYNACAISSPGYTVTDASGEWVDFELYMANGSGGAGYNDNVKDANGLLCGFGHAISDTKPSSSMANFVYPCDPGDRSVFRYDDGKGFEDAIAFAGEPYDLPVITNAATGATLSYDSITGVTAGEQRTFSVPAGSLPVAGGGTATCIGWKVYSFDPETGGNLSLVSQGAGNTVNYTHPTGLAGKVVWVWRIDTAVSVAAGTGGTASLSGDASIGGTVTLTATPDAGKAFFRWIGDIGLADPADPEISFTVAGQARTVTALFGNEIVVNADGYGNYTSLNAAVAAASNYDTVLVKDGTYVNDTTAFLVIDKPIKVVSENGAEHTCFRGPNDPSGTTIKSLSKGINLNSDLAILKGLTLRNFGTDGRQTPQGLGLYLQRGLVEYCTVSNTLPNHGASALHMTGGETRHSLIAYNRSNNNQNAPGAGVYLEGGTITNCVIRGNRAWKNHGGGIYVAGASARVTGCVIDGNVCDFNDNKSRYGGGVYLENGVVDNCVITNNTAALAAGVCQVGGTLLNGLIKDNHSARSYGGVYSTGGAIEDCIISDNTAKVSGGQALCMTAGSISGTMAIESLHAIPGSAIISIAPAVTVSDCEFQCPNIPGATEINSSLYYAEGDCFVEASHVVGIAPLAIDFTAHCLGDASAAEWNFGDGAMASGATAAHAFEAPGAYSVTLTVGAESATLVIYVLPTDTYVSTTGSNEFPYDTWEKAAHDLQSAIDAAYADDNVAGTVHVAAGTYQYTGANRNSSDIPWFMVAKPVSIVGPDEGRALFDGKNNTRGMYLFHPQTSVRNLTFYRCRNGQDGGLYIGGAIYMTGGVVSNCHIIACHGNYDGAVTAEGGWLQDCYFGTNSCIASGDDRRGAGLQIYGPATAAGCIFENNAGGFGGGAYMNHASSVISNCVFRANSAGSCGGGAVTIDAGLLTHCVITNNTSKGAGGGLQMRNSSSYVRNCVVAFNKSTNTGSSYGISNGKAGGGGVSMTGGTIENCTFYGDTSASATRCDELSMGGGTVRNCIFVGKDATTANDVRKSGGTATYCFFRTEVAGDGNITGDAKLKNPGIGDFRLMYGSPCVDAGMVIATVATDISGAARPIDGDSSGTAEYDMGAYEMDFAGQMNVSFEADVTTGGGETVVTFTAQVSGGTAPYSYKWTVGGLDYVTSEPTFTHTFSYGSHDVSLVVTDADNNASETVTRSSIVSIKSPVVFVSTTGSGTWPYETWEKATDDWTLALTAVYATEQAPGRVLVADGTYTAHDSEVYTANISLPVIFMGTNSGCRAVFDGQDRVHPAVAMNNAGAMLCNITLSNFQGGYGGNIGSAIDINNGVVSNCVFTGGRANGESQVRQTGGLLVDSVIKDHDAATHSGGDRYAGGLDLLGGTAERLVISGNIDGAGGGVRVHGATAVLRDSVIRGNYSETGGAVLLNEGLVENCVITNNIGKGNSNNNLSPKLAVAGTGAYVTGGTMRNCLVAGNRLTRDFESDTAAALCVYGGTVYNNTVWGNTLYGGATNDLHQTGGTVANTIAGVGATTAGTFESNSIGLEPGFRDLAAGDYSPAAKSPCRNTGDWSYWGATKAEARSFLDLAGKPRFVGIAIDIGCYENQAGDATRLLLQ